MTETVSPFEIALGEAERWWDAEEENARRLASRERLFVTVGLALTGLSAKDGVQVVAAVWADHTDSAFAWTFLFVLAAGVLLVLWGIFSAAGGLRRNSNGTSKQSTTVGNPADEDIPALASRRLGFGKETLEQLQSVPVTAAPSAEFFRATAFSRVAKASELLSRFNEEKRVRIERAQRIFAVGLFLVAFAVSLYAVSLRRTVTDPRRYNQPVVRVDESPKPPSTHACQPRSGMVTSRRRVKGNEPNR